MSDQWIRPLEAVALLQDRFGSKARSVIINRCSRGLLDGRGEIVVRTYENCFESKWSGYLSRNIENPLDDTRGYDEILPPSFWGEHFADEREYPSETAIGFSRDAWSNWDIGDFGYRELWRNEDSAGILRCDVAGMRFNSEQMSVFALQRAPIAIEVRSRKGIYDWESVLVDLAGALSQGLLVPDAFAYGALADLERWMLEWFAANVSAHPAEGTVRPKAKRVLDAIQREQSKPERG